MTALDSYRTENLHLREQVAYYEKTVKAALDYIHELYPTGGLTELENILKGEL